MRVWKNKQKYKYKKGRLKVGKYFQTAFGLVGKNFSKRPRGVRTARVRFDAGYGLFSCMYLEDTVNEFLLNIYVMIRHLLHNSIVPGTVLI